MRGEGPCATVCTLRGQVSVGTGHIQMASHAQQVLSLPSGPPLVPNGALGTGDGRKPVRIGRGLGKEVVKRGRTEEAGYDWSLDRFCSFTHSATVN